MTGYKKHWALDDIPWDNFDPLKVDPEMLRIVKGAALVEHNGSIYAEYLSNVFFDDPDFQSAAVRWGAEEVQHGEALVQWVKLADPSFDFESRFKDFSSKITLPTSTKKSVRGSRCGELVARCMVEVGTSSYYTALREATTEPVLREICRNIARDEIRHYKLFYSHMARYRKIERLGIIRRILVGVSRISESEDDELAYAYYAANNSGEKYDRKQCVRAYMSRAYGFYRPHHVERGIMLIFKAVGIKPHSKLASLAAKIACYFLNAKANQQTSTVQ
jgi:rubrerythrin